MRADNLRGSIKLMSARKCFTSTSSHSRGFTLIELMVVITIIGILATIALVMYSGIQKSARDAKRIGDIDAIRKALEQYYTAYNFTYPAEVSGNTLDNIIEINFLNNFSDGKAPKDPLFDSDPTYQYMYYYCNSTNKYIVCAKPEDSKKGNRDNLPDDPCIFPVEDGGTNPQFYCKSSIIN